MKILMFMLLITTSVIASSQQITHTIHLSDSLVADSVNTMAYWKGKQVLDVDEKITTNTEEVTNWHYFLALMAFYKEKEDSLNK